MIGLGGAVVVQCSPVDRSIVDRVIEIVSSAREEPKSRKDKDKQQILDGIETSLDFMA